MSFWVCAEYWVNRYQTMIAAIAAIVGVYYAARPAWRQVALMERQIAHEKQERLAAKYRMMQKAIQLLDDESWRTADPVPRPATDAGSDEQNNALLAAHSRRKARTEKMIADLRALDLPPEALPVVDTFERKALWEGMGCVEDMETVVEHLRSQGFPYLTQLWFHCVDQPDRWMSVIMSEARRELQSLQGGVVNEMVQPA